jgi:autotransporter-associated beta strand protein
VLQDGNAYGQLLWQNPINLNGSTRTISVTATSTANYATISGAIGDSTGSGAGLTKTGVGLLQLSGANTYTGANTISAGTLEFVNETSLYNNTTASWTAANIIVPSASTLALAVGGSGQFTTTDV